jgi:anhydro-N-acetylmuramic acid kinase
MTRPSSRSAAGRPRVGGSGAPLMQFLDFVPFRDIGPILTLNIGGITNFQLADKDDGL